MRRMRYPLILILLTLTSATSAATDYVDSGRAPSRHQRVFSGAPSAVA